MHRVVVSWADITPGYDGDSTWTRSIYQGWRRTCLSCTTKELWKLYSCIESRAICCSRTTAVRSRRPYSRGSICRLNIASTCVARPHLHGLGTFASVRARDILIAAIDKIYPDPRPKDERVLCTQVSCTGEDVEAKFTNDTPHAVTTRCDWLLQFYLAYLSMTSLQHMPHVLAIYRSMTKNDLSRRRVRY